MNKMNIFIKNIFTWKKFNQSGTNNLFSLRRGKECKMEIHHLNL